ncbi:MAG: hypothetical protein ABFR90_07110, partial [Planctomycetota bacterium]
MKKGLFVLAAVLIMSSFASATFYQAYDPQVGLTVDYTGIEESNAGSTALFGAPQISGDLLYFTSTNFYASSADGGGLDYIDGQLNVTLDAHDGYDIDSVELEEFGDFGLDDFVGLGTDVTMVKVVALAQIDILEVDGVSLGANFVHANGDAVYTPVSPVTEGKFDLINHGPGVYAPVFERSSHHDHKTQGSNDHTDPDLFGSGGFHTLFVKPCKG